MNIKKISGIHLKFISLLILALILFSIIQVTPKNRILSQFDESLNVCSSLTDRKPVLTIDKLPKIIYTPKNQPECSDAFITGPKLTITNSYMNITMNGPNIGSMRLDGEGMAGYGDQWLCPTIPSGYEWYLDDGSWLQNIIEVGEWVNETLGSGFEGKYSISYKAGPKISAILTLFINQSDLSFNFQFTTLQNIVAFKNGWKWVFNQTTDGYDINVVDMMWGYVNGEGRHAMTMHQNKRRAFHYIWNSMDEYWYQGTESANAAINFTPPPADRNHLFLNDSNYLSVVTWNWDRHIGNNKWSVPLSTVIERTFQIKINPVKNWKENGPADYPRFSIDTDQTIGSDGMDYGDTVTRLFWERQYTYGVGIDGNWIDWFSSQFAWNTPYYHRELMENINKVPISEAGHCGSWGPLDGWPFPDNDTDMFNENYYETRHPTTNPNFLTAIWRVWQWTGNDTWLMELRPKIYKVAQFMIDMILEADEVDNPARVANIPGAPGAIPIIPEAEGLLLCDWNGHHGASGGIGNNYWDIQPFGWLDAYVNALVYGALLALADIEEFWGNMTESENYFNRAMKLRNAYTEVFYDWTKGRYIGCIDAWGNIHDYGFTFINQQAAFYGLEWGLPLSMDYYVHQMYNWMENEPTATGNKDTFSRWIYAAVANTEINNRYYLNRTSERDWWVAQGQYGEEGYQQAQPWPWCGTGNGQLQNGGCSSYTSFHDIMARFGYFSADNAENRFREILDRWSLPDHMCGGSLLYLGENPQQEYSGSVGTDYPFPETGLIPNVVIYGAMGAIPRWKPENISAGVPAGHVLCINASLPSNWREISVQNMLFGGMTINLTVNETHVKMECPTIIPADLQIEVGGIRYVIADIVNAQNEVIIAHDFRAAELIKRYNAAVQEYELQNLIMMIFDCNGEEALMSVPDLSTPNLLEALDEWWAHTILLMQQNEYLDLKMSIEYLKSSINLPPKWLMGSDNLYDYVKKQLDEAEDSLERGDLRWQLYNLYQAKVIADRIDIGVIIIQVGVVPGIFIITAVIVAKQIRKGRLNDVSNK